MSKKPLSQRLFLWPQLSASQKPHNRFSMSADLISSMSLLIAALSDEASAALGPCHLVTVDFENVAPHAETHDAITVKRLKLSGRTFFLQAALQSQGQVIFKGRAVFKADFAPLLS